MKQLTISKLPALLIVLMSAFCGTAMAQDYLIIKVMEVADLGDPEPGERSLKWFNRIEALIGKEIALYIGNDGAADKDNASITLRHKPQGVEEVRSYSKLESRKMSYYELPSQVSRVSNRRYEEGPPVYYGAIVSTLHFKDGQTVDWVVGADLKGFKEFHFVGKDDGSAEPALRHMPDYNSDSGFFYALDLFVKEFEILRVARF